MTTRVITRPFVADSVGCDTTGRDSTGHDTAGHDTTARHPTGSICQPCRNSTYSQVLGCLGLSSEGTLHLCDATGTLRLQTLLPAARLPLGQVVLVGHESRLIFEEVAPLRDVDKRFGHVYLEANVITPVFPCEGCPHMPSEALSETG